MRMISTCSIGTDMFDLEAASELGIVVSNQPGRIAPIVGEHIVALMFAASKRMAFQTSELKAGRWTRMENIFLQGKTLGLIGAGNVGREVARLANALGMEVIAWTFNPDARSGGGARRPLRRAGRPAGPLRRREHPGEAERRQPEDGRGAGVRDDEAGLAVHQRRSRRADRHGAR